MPGSRKPSSSPLGTEPQLVKLVRKDAVTSEEWDALRPKGRKALRTTTKEGQASARGASQGAPPRGLAESLAASHAEEYEFEPARREAAELTKRSMTAAEAGVRLQSLLLRHPGLLAEQKGKQSATLEGGGGMPREGSVPKRELLPLPLPKISLLRNEEISKLFPLDEAPSSDARKKRRLVLAICDDSVPEQDGLPWQVR